MAARAGPLPPWGRAMNSRRVACRLEEPGIVCALGSGAFQVHARMMAGDTSGLRAESGWLDGRSPALAAVHEALPAFPSHLPAHLNSRNNRLLLAAALQIESRLRDAIARLGAARVGIVLGTSTSGVNDNAAGFSALASAGAWPQATTIAGKRSTRPPSSWPHGWASRVPPTPYRPHVPQAPVPCFPRAACSNWNFATPWSAAVPIACAA